MIWSMKSRYDRSTVPYECSQNYCLSTHFGMHLMSGTNSTDIELEVLVASSSFIVSDRW
jgi:hypothetical protein